MTPRSLAAALTRNGKQKLAALALAVLLWVQTLMGQRRVEWVRVPLEIQVVDPRYEAVLGGAPDWVDARVSGTVGDLVRMTLWPRPVRLVVADAAHVAHGASLHAAMIQMPRRSSLQVHELRPARVSVRLRTRMPS